MSQIISLNKSLAWACKTFIQHWQLALMFVAFELGLFFLFGYLGGTTNIELPTEITSAEQLAQLSQLMTPSTQLFARLLRMCIPFIANVIYIPCAFALYQKGAVWYKDAIPSLPVVCRYLLFAFFYIVLVLIAVLGFTVAYFLSSTIASLFSAHNDNYPVMILVYLSACLIPLLCLAGLYLLGRYYLTFCVLFHEKVGFIASLKRAAQLARGNWITTASLCGLEILFSLPSSPLRSPLYFIGILIAIHAYGAMRGTEPYAQQA